MFKAKINKNTPRLPPTPANFVLSLDSRLEKFPPAPAQSPPHSRDLLVAAEMIGEVWQSW